MVVELSCSEADLNFVRLVLDQEQRLGTALSVDSFLNLSELKSARRLDGGEIARLTQKDLPAARSVTERLVESGLIQAHGVRKGRTYTLMSPAVYRDLGEAAHYVRQAGFDPLQQEQMVLSYVAQHGRIRRQDVVDLCRLGPDQTTRLLQRLVKEGKLVLRGQRKGAFYERG